MSSIEEKYIELPWGQTAQPGKCGSCKHFGRRAFTETYIKDEGVVLEAMKGGYCKFKLPPHVQQRQQEEGGPTNWCNDTDSCDLWKSSGKVYIEKHKVTP